MVQNIDPVVLTGITVFFCFVLFLFFIHFNTQVLVVNSTDNVFGFARWFNLSDSSATAPTAAPTAAASTTAAAAAAAAAAVDDDDGDWAFRVHGRPRGKLAWLASSLLWGSGSSPSGLRSSRASSSV